MVVTGGFQITAAFTINNNRPSTEKANIHNKVMVDTSRAMRPIVNLSEEDRATDIGNMHKNVVKIARVVPEIS